MRKLTVMLSVFALVLAIGAGTSIAYKSGSDNAKSKSDKATYAKHWRAKLVPAIAAPTGPTGPTGSTGATGATGATTATSASSNPTAVGVSGKVIGEQNKVRLRLDVSLKGLTPGATYKVALYEDTDGTGCASAANVALDPPAFKPVIAKSNGKGRTRVKVKRAELSLLTAGDYYIAAADAGDVRVACGDLKPKKNGKKAKSHKHD